MNPLRLTTRFPFLSHHHRLVLLRSFTGDLPQPTSATTISPVNQSHLLRVCTILYQQQRSPFPKLLTHLHKTEFHLSHEFFLQVCNKFPLSWRPVHLFFQFTLTRPDFTHSPTSFTKLLDVVGKSRNLDLFWDLLNQTLIRRFLTHRARRIAFRTLAGARELKKCVDFFHLMNSHGYCYSLETLNSAVEGLCRDKLVDEAKHVVFKIKEWIQPDGVTYRHLICGFCESGDVIEASKLWNLMVEDGIEGDIVTVNKMIETFFKRNQFGEALKLFQAMRVKRMEELGLSTYSLVIDWLCKKGKLSEARQVFDEMRERGIEADDEVVASVVYGLVSKRRIREAYLMAGKIERPSLRVYHGLIKGLLRVKSAREATEVFREMIRRGCEPTMHTYIMLLQAHLGRRGRKGRDPLVNFDTIFVGGLVKAGKFLEVTKYVERAVKGGTEVPRFDYNKFLQCYSNEEGVVMFEEVSKKLREVGLFDLADIFARYGEKMATRDRRRNRLVVELETSSCESSRSIAP